MNAAAGRVKSRWRVKSQTTEKETSNTTPKKAARTRAEHAVLDGTKKGGLTYTEGYTLWVKKSRRLAAFRVLAHYNARSRV